MPRLACFLLLLFFTALLPAQTDSLPASPLRVGVVESPPYCIRDADGNWHGMSVELWRHVAEAGRLRYELVPLTQQDSLLPLLEAGRVDVLLHLAVTPEGERRADFLQPVHRTSLGVALPMEHQFWGIVSELMSKELLYIVLGLSVLLLLVGTVIYLLERDDNEDQFGGDRSLWEGIGSGFWWAGVTMTTIGYGDKSPHTLGGRAVAMLWMLVAMAVTSSLTVAIISAVDAPRTIEFPHELQERHTGAIADSPAAAYLGGRGIAYTTFEDPLTAMRALNEGRLEAFVDDVASLRYQLRANQKLAAFIQATDAEPEAFAFAVAAGSPLREPLDRAVIQVILTEMWRDIVNGYAGPPKQ